MPPLLGIVADDLTGSIDTAGPFAAAGLRTMVLVDHRGRPLGAGWDVLCYNTQSRVADASAIGGPVRRATRALLQQGAARLYKKIDSTLRGHIGAEMSAMMDEADAAAALVAPAFPSQRRTQLDGVIYAEGLPLHLAPEGRDPLGAPESSSVVELLRRQTGRDVGLISLAAVQDGEAEIEKRTASLLNRGCLVVAFDAVLDEHLARIDSALDRFPTALLVGSAGLASAMARRMAGGVANPDTTRGRKTMAGSLVVVSGSLNQTTQAQLARLRGLLGIRAITMDADAILRSVSRERVERCRTVRAVREALRASVDLSLCWAGGQDMATAAEPHQVHRDSHHLNGFLRELAPEALAGGDIGCLVLVGGDTAYSVLTGLGAEGIVIDTEVLPGISMGTIAGGVADSVPVLAKAGGFGAPDALVRVVEHLRGGRS